MKSMVASKLAEYRVERQFVNGNTDEVASDVTAVEAAHEFWRCTKNVSAMSGLVIRVVILDGLDQINLAWEQGRGYSYDGGETFYKTPIPDEGWH